MSRKVEIMCIESFSLVGQRSTSIRRATGARATFARVRRLVVLLLVVGLTSACSTWAPATLAPQQLLEVAEPPSPVRVGLADGTLLVFEDPVLRRDSIVGPGERCRISGDAGDPAVCQEIPSLSVSLGKVQSVEVRETSVLRPVVGILLVPAALTAALAVAFCASGC
jgi:hypothetical protein